MGDNTHVVGQMQGYLLQVRHMLNELISLEDITVSVEKIDDVAVETEAGTIAEQLKSVTSKGNPVSDKSDVFWKTLYNWHNYIRDGEIELSTAKFQFIVVSNKKIPVGDIPQKMFQARTKEEAKQVLLCAKKLFWGEKEELKGKVSETYSSYLEALFASSNEEIVVPLIQKMNLDVYEKNYDEKLVEKFYKLPLPREYKSNIFIYMLGWVNEKVNFYAKQGLPPIITSNEFRRELETQSTMYYHKDLIPMLGEEVSKDKILAEVEGRDIYIRQLDFIESELDDKLDAASAYLQTKAEINIRAEKGLITHQIMDEYENKVCTMWKNQRKIVVRISEAGKSDEEQGRALYLNMCNDVLQLDSSYPSFWGEGTLQSLANSPSTEPKIGWHPRYKELLKEGEDE